MKKFFTLALFAIIVSSCTPQLLDNADQQATEKPKICPPWDAKNCNGIPDDQEFTNP